MPAPRRKQARRSPTPIGHAPSVGFAYASLSSPKAVGFDPLADSTQTPDQQRGSIGQFLLAPVQSSPPLIIHPAVTRQLGYISIPPYVGWVEAQPRIVLPIVNPPDDALPLPVAYANGPTPLPDPNDTAGIAAWLTNSATIFHTQFSVTLEGASSFLFGTPYSAADPMFLPPGNNIAVFSGLTTGLIYSDDCWCSVTMIASPRNETLLNPAALS